MPWPGRLKLNSRPQYEGVIKPVQKWAAPIVLILKRFNWYQRLTIDDSICICGDYKLIVIQESKLNSYPIPKVEDHQATLGWGEKFIKLDMSQAYQQLWLDDEYKQYTTINTHKRLYPSSLWDIFSTRNISGKHGESTEEHSLRDRSGGWYPSVWS